MNQKQDIAAAPGAHSAPATRVTAAVAVTKAARSAFYVLLTALIAYQFEVSYGLSSTSTQALVSMASLAGFIRPLLGYWGDVRQMGTHRRKNYMSLGNVLYLAAIAMLLLLPNPMLSSGYLVILVSFVIYGLGEAFIDVGTDSLVLDVATTPAEKSRLQAYARFGAVAGSLGTYAIATGTIGPGAPYPVLLAVIAAAIVVGTALTLRVSEAPVTRGQVLEQVARARPSVPANYKGTLWIAGVAFLLTPLAENLVNVQLEPWLIVRYGNPPAIFYTVELAGAAIAVVALLGVVFLLRRQPMNVAVFIIPAGLVAAAYFAGLPWLAPDLGSYAAWNAVKVAAGAFAVLGMERVLMDVVKGARKGATFQVFVLFSAAGSSGGTILGAVVGEAIGIEVLLAIAGCIVAAAVAVYAFVLAPRLDITKE